MLEVHRTYRVKIRNHSQVADSLDRHGWNASKLWNVANYHSREVWEKTGEIPNRQQPQGQALRLVGGLAVSSPT